MPDSRALPSWRRFAGIASIAVCTGLLLIAATLLMFSRLMLYDDEGYILLSLKNFTEHGALYRDVYTQYGPLPYVFFQVLALLGLPINHMVGRSITILLWTGTVLGCAWIVWRVTRRYVLVIGTIAAVFTYLWVMANEPPHPGGLIIFIVTLLAALGGRWLMLRREMAWAALMGAGIAALVLTKINIGVFAAASAATWIALNFRDDFIRRWSPWATAAAWALLPLALMRQLLKIESVETFALTYSLSAAAAAGATSVGRTARFGWREVGALLAGGFVVTFVVVGAMAVKGTTPMDLIHGVVLSPLQHPVSFNMPIKWAPATRAVTLLSAGLFVTALLLRKTGRRSAADTMVAWLRLAAAGGLAIAFLQFPALSADNVVLAYGLSCAWCFAWPLVEGAEATTAISWVALLQLGQFLHAFPVPGSQIAWGSFLALPVVAMGAWQAAGWLAPRLPAVQARPTPWMWTLSAGVLGVAAFLTVQFGRIGNQYFTGRNLTLPGAEWVRLPTESTARCRLLCFNALAHCDLLFSLPGMFSYNLWTGLPTPTHANVTHWFSLLTVEQQHEIIRVLEAHPQAGVIVETRHVDFLRKHDLAPKGPLYDYIEQTFAPILSVDYFEFRVRKGRRAAPYFTAEFFQKPSTPTSPIRDKDNTRIVMPLLLPKDQAIGSIELVSQRGLAAAEILNNENARIEVTPITVQGDAHGPTEAQTFPFKLNGSSSVAFYFDGKDRPFSLADTVIILRNPAGAELGLVRLRP